VARRRLTDAERFPPGYFDRPIVLDVFCGGGGAAKGYVDAGFRVIGIDNDPLMLKRYPWESHLAPAIPFLEYLYLLGEQRGVLLEEIAMIHASPPCEAYSKTARIGNSSADKLIEVVRNILLALGKPYAIENVEEARYELIDPIMLCGTMFPAHGLRVYRHRYFETSFPVEQPRHYPHTARQAKMGRPVEDGDFIQVVGNFSNADYARAAMGIPWLGRNQLKEAIPPAYTQYIGDFVPMMDESTA
jgi:DNA (cytosine-5)-methyltransferase 1